MNPLFDPNSYIHLGDDSAMIQAAVNAAAATGETVTIPRYNARTGQPIWNLERAIRLYSGSVICLDNCTLRQADGMFENIFINANQDTPAVFTREGRQHDIKIYGLGNALLDGGNHNGFTEHTQTGPNDRPATFNCVFNFMNVERIEIKDIRIINQRYWAFVFHYCAHCHISNIDFRAVFSAPNQDGIDLRTGCNNFLIENITGCTGDDTVALTCLRSRYDEAMKAAQLDDGIHHVIIRNVCSRTNYALVRLLNHRGKVLHDIIVENIMESTEGDPAQARCSEYPPLDPEAHSFRAGACVRIGENYYYGDGPKAQLSDTYNVTVRNVVGRMRTGIRVSCALNNAAFDNIQIFGDGGTAVHFAEGTVKNIRVSNIGYSMVHAPRPTDDNRSEGKFNRQPNPEAKPDRKLCAVFFKETNAENISFSNVYASDQLTAVFGGNGTVSMWANNVIREDPNTPLFDPDLSVTKLQTSDF